jgi:hypothetical protein
MNIHPFLQTNVVKPLNPAVEDGGRHSGATAGTLKQPKNRFFLLKSPFNTLLNMNLSSETSKSNKKNPNNRNFFFRYFLLEICHFFSFLSLFFVFVVILV